MVLALRGQAASTSSQHPCKQWYGGCSREWVGRLVAPQVKSLHDFLIKTKHCLPERKNLAVQERLAKLVPFSLRLIGSLLEDTHFLSESGTKTLYGDTKAYENRILANIRNRENKRRRRFLAAAAQCWIGRVAMAAIHIFPFHSRTEALSILLSLGRVPWDFDGLRFNPPLCC